MTISHAGYAKTQPLTDYQAQRRGGMGKSATQVKDEDFVEHLLIASTHATILCFSNLGKVYWLKVFHIPLAGRNSRRAPDGKSAASGRGRASHIYPARRRVHRGSLHLYGHRQRHSEEDTHSPTFARQRSVGLRALQLEEGDVLVGTAITQGDCDVMLFSSRGQGRAFHAKQMCGPWVARLAVCGVSACIRA